MVFRTASQQQDIKENFLYKLGARARITTRVHQEAHFTPPSFDIDSYQSQYMQYNVMSHPIVEVEMPLNKFEELVDTVNDLELVKARYGPDVMRAVQTFQDQQFIKMREESIRRSNPGVQKAWERYQTMLKLAGE